MRAGSHLPAGATGSTRAAGAGTLCLLLSLSFLSSPAAQAGADGPGRAYGNLFASAALSESTFVAAGDRGAILLSSDQGATWKAVESHTKEALASLCFPDPVHGWAVGQRGVILHSADSGQSWNPQPSGVRSYLLDVDFFDSTRGVAVGADSTVVTTADGGRTWERSDFRLPEDTTANEFHLYAAAAMDSGKTCIAGDRGRIFVSGDSGRTWHEAESPLYDADMGEGSVIYSIARDAGNLYAVGIDGVLIISRDHGDTWTRVETGFPGPDLFCIDMVDGTGLAAGRGGHALQTSDRGATWHPVLSPRGIHRYWLSGVDLRKTPDGAVIGLIVGQDGLTGLFLNGTVTWRGPVEASSGSEEAAK